MTAEEKLKNEYKKAILNSSLTLNDQNLFVINMFSELNDVNDCEKQVYGVVLDYREMNENEIFKQALFEAQEIKNSPLYKIMNEVENE